MCVCVCVVCCMCVLCGWCVCCVVVCGWCVCCVVVCVCVHVLCDSANMVLLDCEEQTKALVSYAEESGYVCELYYWYVVYLTVCYLL